MRVASGPRRVKTPGMSAPPLNDAVALGLVVPCYNEAQRIKLHDFAHFLGSAPSAGIIFVDDGSTDHTRDLVQSLVGRFDGRAVVITLPKNAGKAEAVRLGLLHARGSSAAVVGFWDADLATPLTAVFDLLAVLETHAHVDWVLGSRVRVLGRDIERSALRHYLGRVFATAASLTLAMPVYDTQCGAKLFRATPELDAVLAEPFISHWIFDVEMIARFDAVRVLNGAPHAVTAIHEFPLARWADAGASKVRVRHFFQALLDLARICHARNRAMAHARNSARSRS